MTSPATDLTEIEKSLCWLIADQTGITPARVTLDAKIVADLGLDSLDLVELIMACEEHFGVALPDEGDNAVYGPGRRKVSRGMARVSKGARSCRLPPFSISVRPT